MAAQRIHDIDPDIKVTTHRCFFGPETQDQFDFTQYDYVVDAIDTVTGKLALVMKCKEAGTSHHLLHGRRQQDGPDPL